MKSNSTIESLIKTISLPTRTLILREDVKLYSMGHYFIISAPETIATILKLRKDELEPIFLQGSFTDLRILSNIEENELSSD